MEPLAGARRARDVDAVVVAHEGKAPRSAAEVVSAFVDGLDAGEEWVLIPHSNAGLLAPAVARRRPARGVVYVDSRLPGPGVGPMRPPETLGFLSGLADAAGDLPPWNRWWDEDISHLFPSRVMQRACEAEMRSLPLSYFSDAIDGAGAGALPSAYLAFGTQYGDEAQHAAAAGWPTATVAATHHLHMLVDPDGVAVHILSLLAAIGFATDARCR